MNMLLMYLMLCTGLVSLVSNTLGFGALYLNYADEAILVVSSIYCIFLIHGRKIVITGLTLSIAAYILFRLTAVSSFALLYDYDLAAYLLPLKNWIILVNFFIIGQSVVISKEEVNALIIRALFITILCVAAYELYASLFVSVGIRPDLLQSRFPFIRHRIVIDEFLIVYVYLILSIKMIRSEITLRTYQSGLVLLVAAFLISQAKQTLIGIFIVSLYLIAVRFDRCFTRRKVIFTALFSAASVVLVSAVYLLITQNPQDTYYSLWRRSLLLDYIQDKFNTYPLFGYPIPSAAFGGLLPADIVHYFYGFNFDYTLFPTDLPFLFIVSEEGLAGLLFVSVFLYFSYKANPKRTVNLIVVLFAMIGTFRMYYLNPVGSSFTYFMLGLLTRKELAGQSVTASG